MAKYLITTVRRYAPFNEPSGYIYTVDFEHKKILKRSIFIEPEMREFETNPRGGMRGIKGIFVTDDHVAIANYSNVFLFDLNWQPKKVITHPSCAGIHDIIFSNNSIWVTSSRSDTLFSFDFSSKLLDFVYLREKRVSSLLKGWGAPILLTADKIQDGDIDFRDPRTHVLEDHDRAHVNSICELPDGDKLVSLGYLLDHTHATLLRVKTFLYRLGIWSTIVSFNQWLKRKFHQQTDLHSNLIVQPARGKSVILRMNREGEFEHSLTLPNLTVPSHSLVGLSDSTAIYLNTTDGSVVHFDPMSEEILSETRVTDGFLRGAVQVDGEKFLLGSKGKLLLFDLETKHVVEQMIITENPHESVYDIKLLPPKFAIPPDDFSHITTDEKPSREYLGD